MSLFGSGTNALEGRRAELMCTNIEVCEMVQILNTGTEAMAALRLARGATGRDHVIVMQGGFNGSYIDVACNVLRPLEVIGPRVSPGSTRSKPGSAIRSADTEKSARFAPTSLCSPRRWPTVTLFLHWRGNVNLCN
jgi:glutamate-1-semialdehyde aminotransferase